VKPSGEDVQERCLSTFHEMEDGETKSQHADMDPPSAAFGDSMSPRRRIRIPIVCIQCL
jgi:hypothetical protein